MSDELNLPERLTDEQQAEIRKQRVLASRERDHRRRKSYYQVEVDDFLNSSRKISAVHNMLVTEHFTPMKESIFVGYFLPRILGEIVDEPGDIEANMDDGFDLSDMGGRGISWSDRWIKAVGSPSGRVKVFHDITGAFLFDVPPLLMTQVALSEGQRAPMAEILSEYFMRKNNGAAQAANFLYDHIEDTRLDIDERAAEHDEENFTAWEFILHKYRSPGSSVLPDGSIDSGDADGFAPGTNLEDMFDY